HRRGALVYGGAAAGENPDWKAPGDVCSEERRNKFTQGFGTGEIIGPHRRGPSLVLHSRLCARVGLLGERCGGGRRRDRVFRFRGGNKSPAGTGNARELLWKLCGAGESGAKVQGSEKGGPEGFVKAAKAIGEAIKENVYNENEILCGAEKWPEEYGKLVGKRQYGVAGSPRFDFYAADYRWGKAKKLEALFIDDGAVLSLCKSRDFEGGLEIVLSKPMPKMDAFSRVFRRFLANCVAVQTKRHDCFELQQTVIN
ncbi:anthocyanidin 3-o-glucoside 6''-o-acyltransferase, partial [Phtheirospermum japonicum]